MIRPEPDQTTATDAHVHEVRKLESGDWVIDLGRSWIRVRANGEVVTKTAVSVAGEYGHVESRRATESEAKFARAMIAQQMGQS
jgi:hypothetical protein